MRKIMFSDKYGLTKAVLEGRKTMTRRVVPECKALDILRHWEHNEGAIATGYEEHTHSFRFDYCPDKKRRTSIDHLNLIPFYKVGEIVAVAQSYEKICSDFESGKYDNCGIDWEYINSYDVRDFPGFTNKMFVAADLMPHQIRITDVRVERLQDISNEDCIKEGIGKNSDIMNYSSPREAFASLIDRVSGKGTWQSNPWVFVYEFELVK